MLRGEICDHLGPGHVRSTICLNNFGLCPSTFSTFSSFFVRAVIFFPESIMFHVYQTEQINETFRCARVEHFVFRFF